ncbi:MAG: FxsA family protein [Methylotenera sp.]|nr:FxsA family protein [Methylotenera sp.]
MRLILTLALLAFPIAEIWILINLFQQYGWWVLLYLVAVGLLGLQLIRDEKLLFSGRMMQSLSQGGNPMKAMFGSARNIFAGVLLIIPGVITDLIAVVLLLIPVKNDVLKSPKYTQKAANDDVIEGEFRRED